MLVWFGTGLNALWPLTWFISVPLLWLAPRVSPRTSFWVAFLGFGLGSLNVLHYYAHVIRLPIPILCLALLGPAWVMGSMTLIWRRLSSSSRSWAAPLAFAAMWVTVDYVFYAVTRESTAGFIAYSQAENPLVRQLASLGGIWLVEFVLWWLPAQFCLAIHPSSGQRPRVLVAALVVVFFICGYGALRLNDKERVLSAGVAAMAQDQPLRPMETYRQALAGSAPRSYIVLPEKLAKVDSKELPEWQLSLSKDNACVVVGLEKTDAPKRNLALAFGGREPVYFKHFMVQGFEDNLAPGHDITFVDTGVGVQICRDMGYPELTREYARRGTSLMLVPAWDFSLDRRVAANVARMRAVEGGFSVVRASREGLVSVFDATGETLAETPSGSDVVAQVTASVSPRQAWSLAPWFGDWVAWGCVAIVVVMSALRFLKR